MTSPHDAVAAISPINATPRRMLRITVIPSRLPFDDLGRDEDQQLLTRVVDAIALEQPAENGHAAQSRGPIVCGLFLTDVNAANHGRLAVADEDRRVCALGVDRRDAVDRAAEVGLRV